MRLLKLNSIIHLYTSIYWDIGTNEFHIFTDSGRLLRPIFVLKKIGPKYTNELIEGDYNYAENWNKLIRGSMYELNPDLSVYDERYFREELQELKMKNKDYIQYLEDHQSQIEYIDSMESEGLLISKDIYSIDKSDSIIRKINSDRGEKIKEDCITSLNTITRFLNRFTLK